MELSRPILNDIEFNKKYQTKRIESDHIIKSGINHIKKHYKPSGECTKEFFLARFPILTWLLSYNLKENIANDIISGITIGIVHIPQSMAYTMLSYLPTHVGLYVSIFPVIIYVLFGTSKHLSMGTFAVTAIMTASAILKYDGILYPAPGYNEMSSNGSNTSNFPSNPNFISNDFNQGRILISMSLTFIVGIIQVIFAIFHVGFVAKYLSDSIVAGFTTGAAIHIVVSQIGSLLGYSTKKPKIMFKLIGAFIEIFSHIHETKLAACIISLVTIVILYLVKEQINYRFKYRMFMPVPIELLVVVFGTYFSWQFNFESKPFNVKIVGHVPIGIPAPILPPFHLIPQLIGDAISIAIVSFALNISMAKFFGKKYKYEISSNQELFSYGAGNILAAFFPSYPSCVSLSRCAILEATNAKSQIYAIISTIIVVIVCLFLGPLFRTLPNPCLSAIIVVALKGMVLQILQVPSVYRTSKMEAVAWVTTFLGVMIFDVDVGLYIGIGFSLIMVIFKTQRPRIEILGHIPNTELYLPLNICDQAYELNGIKIICYHESLYYANVENFKYQIIKAAGIVPSDVLTEIKNLSKRKKGNRKISLTNNPNSQTNMISGMINEGFEIEGNTVDKSETRSEEVVLNRLPVKHIILDCSSKNFVDSMGVDTIIQLKDTYGQIGIKLHLTNCKPGLLRLLKKKAFRNKFDFEFIYPTIHDAICSITDKKYLDLNRNRFISEIDQTQQDNNDVDEVEKQHPLKNFEEEFNINYLSRF